MLLAVVAVMACVAMGAEAKKTVGQLWIEGGWENWTEVIKAAESGAVETKGGEWIVLLAKYMDKAITAEQLWNQSCELFKTKPNGNLYTNIGWRICRNEPADSAIVATVKADIEKTIAGKDEALKKMALAGKARIIFSVDKDYYNAFTVLLESKIAQDWFGSFGREALRTNEAKASEIYKGLVSVMKSGVHNGNPARMILETLNKSAILANIPAPEVVSTLTTIQRLYADKAVGDTPAAKEWGIFLGSLRDVIASWK